MKGTSSIVVLFLLFACTPSLLEAQRFSPNNRRAVVLEAFYALRPSHDGSCDKTINGNCVSNWNFLNSDYSAYAALKTSYGCNSSDWALGGDGSGCVPYVPLVSFYSNPAAYGYGTASGSYGNIGRGGQCRFFANLVANRSLSFGGAFPTYATMWQNVETDLTKAVEGDIITTNPSVFYHTAIVVEIKRTGSTVTGLDLIDANWLTDDGSSNREVVGRHLLTLPQPAGKWGLWKGVGYYYESYIP
jgi:hypothetical protein